MSKNVGKKHEQINLQIVILKERYIIMKKIFLTVLSLFLVSLSVFAGDKDDALKAFNTYVKTANNYDNAVTTFYTPNAKIIRQVIKPDGGLVDVVTDTSTYITQMKLSQAVARARKYKNNYTNVVVTPISAGKVKISSVRHPSVDNDSLKAYMIFQKQPNGKWLIVEELMQTRQQIFLKYAK